MGGVVGRGNRWDNRAARWGCGTCGESGCGGLSSFSCVKQFELPDCMGAVFGRDNLRDNRAVR